MRLKSVASTFLALVSGFSALSLPLPHAALGDDVYNIVIKKQEEKQKSRWSIADWLDTRDRMRVMDMWLALHSPSPYEFFLEGSFKYGQTLPGGTTALGGNGHAGAYASIFGLEFEYESLFGPRWLASFHMRLFGLHVQGTNLTPEVGIRNDEAATTARMLYVGGSLTLYFARFFGVDAVYRHYFALTPGPSGLISGDRIQAGAFIDFSIFRVFGNYFYEPMTNQTTQGFAVGGRLFF